MNDLLQEAIKEEQKEVEFEAAPEQATAAPQYRLSDMLPDMSFLIAKTGLGSIDDYADHPFNVHGSRGIAQILRGITGIAGELDYAIIDITLGTLEVIKEGRVVVQHEQPAHTKQ